MNKDAKTISNSLRPQIEKVKSYIRDAKRPFDGDGYIFKQAVKELRNEGLNIIRQKEQCNYILQNN